MIDFGSFSTLYFKLTQQKLLFFLSFNLEIYIILRELIHLTLIFQAKLAML